MGDPSLQSAKWSTKHQVESGPMHSSQDLRVRHLGSPLTDRKWHMATFQEGVSGRLGPIIPLEVLQPCRHIGNLLGTPAICDLRSVKGEPKWRIFDLDDFARGKSTWGP